MTDLFNTLMEGADAMGNAAIAAVDGIVGFTAANAPGVVGSLGGAVSEGVSGIFSAATELNQSASSAFAGLLNGFNLSPLQSVSGPSIATTTPSAGAGLEANLGDFAPQLAQFAQAKTSGWSMGMSA